MEITIEVGNTLGFIMMAAVVVTFLKWFFGEQ